MYFALLLVSLFHSISCQNKLKPIFQPLNNSHMMMLFNNTLVEKMNHISKVTLKKTSYDLIENRNLAVASKDYTEIFQDTAEIIFQPLDLSQGLLVKIDSCRVHKNLYLVVDCIVGAPSSSEFFSYVPLNYIEDDLDSWICKQDDTTIWMNTTGSSNVHAKTCLKHVYFYQNGELSKIFNGSNPVKPISDEVYLGMIFPNSTEALKVKLDHCNNSMRPDYGFHSELELNSDDVIEKQEHEVKPEKEPEKEPEKDLSLSLTKR